MNVDATTRHIVAPEYGAQCNTFVARRYSNASKEALPHFYSAAAEMFRGFAEIGAVWARIGKAAARPDVVAHAQQLLDTAPK
jgi:hypothetical protein